MNDRTADKIVEAFGYKSASPQYKTILYPLVPLHRSLEDH